ncbi:MAG: VOC family protein [Thermomicrobiales bacterium]
MAYRFLLEVPETLADTANVAVAQAGDAEVVVVRPSHGLGIDDPYVDLTVAAQTLRIVDTLHTWFESLPAPRPEIRVLLHGGERHPLSEVDRGRLVALIRRDQPWVERSMPKVGEHEPTIEPAGFSTGVGATAIPANGAGATVAAVLEDAPASIEAAPSGFAIQGINYVLIQVNELWKAEEFYQSFLNMRLLGRMRRGPDGTQVPLPADYSWERAMQTGELAETTFLANGPLSIAVQRVGLASRLGQGPLELVSLGVDARTFATMKSQVLMRPFTVLQSGVASFVFRDPFMVNWEIAVVGSVPLIPS